MNTAVSIKTYPAPPFDKKEILRYAGCKNADRNTLDLMGSCIDEVREIMTYKVCYTTLTLHIHDDICDFSAFSWRSHTLSKNLDGCNSAAVFGATVGTALDRLISKYGRLSPSCALMLQAIGAERIEALCDLFCEDIKTGRPRFSPGYGDLPLEMQKDIFTLLDLPKRIGLCLNDSMLMSPSKSVTAVVGLE